MEVLTIHAEELLDLSACARNVICLALASCLKQYNQQLSAAHYRTSLLLMNGGTKSFALERCAPLGITTVKPVFSGHRFKWTPSIKWTVAEVPKFISLIYFN